MELKNACCEILNQLSDVTDQIHENDYKAPVGTLGGSSIGQHLRHTLEFFFCLEKGFEKGLVNYDNREHDKLIETDKFIARAAIERITKFISSLDGNKSLKLEVCYTMNEDSSVIVETNYYRELIYNIEHAVHHMAIIKIGLRDVAPYIQLSPGFGIAASTIRYQSMTSEVSK
ncbi:MAG: DinB family protein [Cyclobacteriaceae bacterium]|jgi:uncharacterized damage-inducible protein DinB|nr:DinB family protein [Cyclobacteriaceae bacterium]